MLRPRGMGIMDFIAKTGSDLITPPQASPVAQNQSYLSRSMGRGQVDMPAIAPSTMTTSYPSGMVAMASPTPQVQAMMRGQAPERTATVTPPQVTSASPQMLEPNRMMGPRGAVGSGVMQEGMDRDKMIAANRIAEVEAKNPELKADPSFQDQVKGLFGDRESMLQLALAFNSMRMRPDTGLASVIGTELKDIRAQRVSTRTAEAVAERLIASDMEDEAKLVLANPALASSMLKELTDSRKPLSKVAKAKRDLQNGLITNDEYNSIVTSEDVPADIQTFNTMTAGLPQEDVDKARRIKLGLEPRAGSTLSLDLVELFNRSKASAGGQAAGKSEEEQKQQKVKNDSTWQLWTSQIGGLEEALLGTETGFFSGLLPAVTSNQQMADLAVSRMAPILKNIFRESGEGVFTDQDQALLLGMIPDRSTNPAAIAYAIQSIDAMVRAKLGQPMMSTQGFSSGAVSQ